MISTMMDSHPPTAIRKRFMVFILLVVSMHMWAQLEEVPVFRTSAEAVLVPVAVREKSGKLASGLQKDKFKILVDGKQVELASFEEVRSTGVVSPLRREPGTYNNLVADQEHPRRTLVLLLDYMNTPYLRRNEAAKAMAEFLNKEMKPDLPVALVALTWKGLSVVQSFTNDAGDLSLALRRSRAQMTRDSALGLYWMTFTPDTSTRSTLLRERIYQTLEELEQLGNALAGVPGRKIVVWVSGAFPFEPRDPRSITQVDTQYVKDYERVWRTLNQANVSLYSVDANGLINTLWNGRFSADHRGPAFNPRTVGTPASLYNTAAQDQDTLRQFANHTGGSYCLNRNDLDKCIAEAENEAEDYYLLSFRAGSDLTRSWHRIQVHVSGGKYEVRAREGFSLEPPKPLSPNAEMHQIGKALRSPVMYTGLPLTLKVLEVKALPKTSPAADPSKLQREFPPAATMRFELHLPPHTVQFDTLGHNALDVTFMAVAIDKKGEFVADLAKSASINLNTEEQRAADVKGVRFESEFVLPEGDLRVRFAVRDRITGRIGTVEAPIHVENEAEPAQEEGPKIATPGS
jgi:VWFA-related protein